MFSPMNRFSSPQALFAAYRKTSVQIDINTASPHRLVELLFDGFMESLAQAHGAIANKDVMRKVNAIRRAISIVDEGLKSALNLGEGGELASDLNDLYAYVSVRLMQANLRNDVLALDECRRLMLPLQQAWTEIGPKVEGGVQP